MPSQIAWLDSTPEEQRVARELIALFAQTESRDELGIGQIRDAFSDLLFPGTSVIQTRARYYLFIPWCYTTGRAAGTYGEQNRSRGELQERELIKTLRGARLDDASGLIGSRAGPRVKILPSAIYWSGMVKYGVRTYAGGIGKLALRSSSGDGATELSERVVTEWDPGIPRPPAGFPLQVPGGFAMSSTEAEWLRGRIVAAAPQSVLAFLLERGTLLGDRLAHPWQAASPEDFEALHHAEWFSAVMEGAALVYNLLVAERYEDRGYDRVVNPVDTYRTELDAWQTSFEDYGNRLDRWDVPQMWQIVTATNPNISHQTRAFVDDWIRLQDGRMLADDDRARELIRNREKRKGKQSRLLNDKLLASWPGNSGVGRLNYRWGTVRTIVNDILRGVDTLASS